MQAYFGKIDLVYDKTDPDFEDRCCHVTYDDDDAEDFSYSEFAKAKEFFEQSTVIGGIDYTLHIEFKVENYCNVNYACVQLI